jgi:hypothetical protein
MVVGERIVLGWSVVPKPWIVERTFVWLGFRRLSQGYGITFSSAENIVVIIHAILLLKSNLFVKTGS